MNTKHVVFGGRPASLALLGLAFAQAGGSLLPACRQGDDASANLPASTSAAPRAPRPSALPSALWPPEPSASGSASARMLPLPAPPPPLKSCRDEPHYGEYWIRVEGDGDPQLLKEGPPALMSGPGRYCAPTGSANGPLVSISGCATEESERSCVYMSEGQLTYYDRQGKRHGPRVSRIKHQVTGDVLDGTANASGPGSLKLKLSFHVGNDVRVLMPDRPDGGAIQRAF